jgi:hypothetical protein
MALPSTILGLHISEYYILLALRRYDSYNVQTQDGTR